MKIGEIETQKCGNCPLIDMCGDAYESPCLCCEERLENVDIEKYKAFWEGDHHEELVEMAEELGLEIHAPERLSEEEQDIYYEENNCFNNYKKVVMELFISENDL